MFSLVVTGCQPSAKAAAGPEKPPSKGPACGSTCVERDSACHQRCLDDDPVAPPPDEGDTCDGKCGKALEACLTACR